MVDQLLGGGEELGIVGERDDTQGRGVQDGATAAPEQRAELVGAPGGGDADGESGEGAVLIVLHVIVPTLSHPVRMWRPSLPTVRDRLGSSTFPSRYGGTLLCRSAHTRA